MMLRRCKIEDRSDWEKLNKEFVAYEYHDENVWENPLERGDITEIFDLIMEDADGANRIYMIEEDGDIVGFMNTVVFLSPWAHGKVLFLDDFFITESYRGKGLGAKAIKELETLLETEDFVRVQLMAEETNPRAQNFYEKQGYSAQKLTFNCKYID